MVGRDSEGDLNMMNSIVCKFGDFDLVPAILTSENEIKCLSPVTGMSSEEDPSLRLDLSLALNGQDFVKIGRVTFRGNAEPEPDPVDSSTFALFGLGIGLSIAICCCCIIVIWMKKKKNDD